MSDASGGGPPAAPGARAAAVLIPLTAVAAGVGCLLPWVREDVDAPGGSTSAPLDGFHGIGVLACAGAALGLLAAADRLRRRGRAPLDDGLGALAATLCLAGALLFLTGAGQPTGSGDGWAVRPGPGLVLTAAAGGVSLAGHLVLAAGRRGGSPPPGSAG